MTGEKAALRRRALALRATLDPGISEALAAHLQFDGRTAIAAFWPLPGEPDVIPLLHRLHQAGHKVLLPRTPKRGHALTFHPWHPGADMSPGPFGTACPATERAVPDFILVPYLAFDRTGGRLGYGGGFYDRTLAAHPETPSAGLGFSALEVPRVPMEPHDVRLKLVITERGKIRTAP